MPCATTAGPPAGLTNSESRVGLLKASPKGEGFLPSQSGTLSDAVSTLNHLFLGSPPPLCLDGADADDSGKIEITDPIRTLGMLFLGQGALPQPYPACGTDSAADDDLGCTESSCP